jgi:hypothetical protein
MPNAGKSEVPAISTNAVVQDKVPAINADLDAISEESHDTMTWHD